MTPSELTREQIVERKQIAADLDDPTGVILCDMALESLTARQQGFAQGVEAAAKVIEARKPLWCFPGQAVALQDAIDTVRALLPAQGEKK